MPHKKETTLIFLNGLLSQYKSPTRVETYSVTYRLLLQGAQMMSETGVLCLVTCSDDSVYPIYSCVKGKLVEVNRRLLDNPSLIVSKVSTVHK